MENPILANDPFSDNAAVNEVDRDMVLESTLAVGRNASLTLGADNLIVLDEGFQDAATSRCCGLLSTRSKPTRSIPFFNILSVELTKVNITIRYAQPISSRAHAPLAIAEFTYDVQSPAELAQKWTSRLLNCAYRTAQRNKRIKVLINPYGGAGKAPRQYYKKVAPIFEAAGCLVDVQKTEYIGHAAEIAQNLNVDDFDVIACASGDGVPMECFNGLAKQPNAQEALRKIAVVQLPCGSGNGMSWNLTGTDECSQAALCIVKGLRTPIDLASITQPGGKRTLSFLSQSIGIVAEIDLGTDHLRWMGDLRFTLGLLVRLLGKTMYPIEIAVKTEIEDKIEIKKHYARERVKRMRRENYADDSASEQDESYSGQGLPPLKYGDVDDPLPTDKSTGWSELQPYPNLGNFYCGNMCFMLADAPFFPASLPNDGMLDLVTINGDVGRWKAVKLLLDVSSNKFFDQDVVRSRKVSAVRVIPRFGSASTSNSPTTQESPKKGISGWLSSRFGGGQDRKGFFAVDGESLPFEPFQIEVHRGLGTVLSRRPDLYEYEGPKGWETLADINLRRPDVTRF